MHRKHCRVSFQYLFLLLLCSRTDLCAIFNTLRCATTTAFCPSPNTARTTKARRGTANRQKV